MSFSLSFNYMRVQLPAHMALWLITSLNSCSIYQILIISFKLWVDVIKIETSCRHILFLSFPYIENPVITSFSLLLSKKHVNFCLNKSKETVFHSPTFSEESFSPPHLAKMFALKTKSSGWLVSPDEFSLVDIWPATRRLKWRPEERLRDFEMATSNLFYRTEPSLCKFQSSTAGLRPNFDQVRISNRFTKDRFESWRMWGKSNAPFCYTLIQNLRQMWGCI